MFNPKRTSTESLIKEFSWNGFSLVYTGICTRGFPQEFSSFFMKILVEISEELYFLKVHQNDSIPIYK